MVVLLMHVVVLTCEAVDTLMAGLFTSEEPPSGTVLDVGKDGTGAVLKGAGAEELIEDVLLVVRDGVTGNKESPSYMAPFERTRTDHSG